MMEAFWPIVIGAFSLGLIVGYSIWEALDRTEWAAYRIGYRRWGALTSAALKEENERLTEDNERLRFRVAEIAGELDDAEEAAEKRVAALQSALERYGQHEEECNSFADVLRVTPCDCGLDTALAKSED